MLDEVDLREAYYTKFQIIRIMDDDAEVLRREELKPFGSWSWVNNSGIFKEVHMPIQGQQDMVIMKPAATPAPGVFFARVFQKKFPFTLGDNAEEASIGRTCLVQVIIALDEDETFSYINWRSYYGKSHKGTTADGDYILEDSDVLTCDSEEVLKLQELR